MGRASLGNAVTEDAVELSMATELAVAGITAPAQRGRPFRAGQSGNPAGCPKGARNKLAETFIAAVADDFAEHGATVPAKLRKTDPATYLKIVSRLVPRELVLERERDPNFADMTEDEVVELLKVWQRYPTQRRT
jgi:predicted secreted protein